MNLNIYLLPIKIFYMLQGALFGRCCIAGGEHKKNIHGWVIVCRELFSWHALTSGTTLMLTCIVALSYLHLTREIEGSKNFIFTSPTYKPSVCGVPAVIYPVSPNLLLGFYGRRPDGAEGNRGKEVPLWFCKIKIHKIKKIPKIYKLFIHWLAVKQHMNFELENVHVFICNVLFISVAIKLFIQIGNVCIKVTLQYDIYDTNIQWIVLLVIKRGLK